MYASYIGKNFLQLYRERKNLSEEYTAKQFFDEVLFPAFFDNDKHLMHVGNSPFFQKPTADAIEQSGSKSLAQLNNLRAKIEAGLPSGAIYVGYAAEDLQATSSGQLTSMPFKIDEEEMYLSWIGQGLGIGVSGGFVMLVDKAETLWAIFEGWAVYRKYVQQTPNLKDKQIETWNGHWLSHVFGKNYDANNPLAGFDPQPQIVIGKLAIPTIDWVKVIFALSRKYSNEVITAYAYNLSQTNTTLGFINLFLPKVRSLIRLKEELYTYTEGVRDQDFEQLYATYYNFKNACKLGVIGLSALEPDKLREFMPSGSLVFAGGKDFKFKNEDDYFQFQIFKTWIIAMLNNKKELNALAEQVAQSLIDFEDRSPDKKRGKTTQGSISDAVKSSKHLREFIDNLTTLMEKDGSVSETFKAVKDAILQLPADLFPLFVTLIRFEYQFKKSTKS